MLRTPLTLILAPIESLLALVGWREKSERYLMQRDALETFSHIASHDLREPLRKMITYTGLVKKKAQGQLDAQSERHLEVIGIGAQQDKHEWTFSFSDNGIGFDPAYKETIFTMFKRLHDKSYAGVGMGLAICRKIVERHGGRIWAASKPGEGATFFFSLPKELEKKDDSPNRKLGVAARE